MALKRLLSRADIALIALLLLASGASWALLAGDDDDKQVAVYVDDALVGRWPAGENRELEVKPGVVVQIDEGRYRIAASPCPHQLCVHQGWQTLAPVVCVPQRVLVVAESKREMMITR